TSVAGRGLVFNGGWYSGLTRDDVMGLRYQLSTNNAAFENPAAGSLLILTNLGGTIPLTTSNLGTLLLTAQTNDPALLSTFFPGIVVNGFTNFWTVVCTPNVVSYLTNYYGEPVGTPGHFIIATNGFTCLPQQNFIDFFG